ncbi:MAG: TIGR00269 family protein [Candidatus Woesearchaeota archaeon]|nr:MAG: TIGR00269 family protein [Candidatus Woesearchaeota archaeon]
MACKSCVEKPVIKLPNNNVQLCKNHYIKYFEKKILKTIRQFNLVEDGDHIGVAISGGKDSSSLLYILNKLAEKRKKVKLTAITIDEGIHGYREHTLKDARKLCEELKIPLYVYSYKEEFGQTLDEALKKYKLKPCSLCGVLRRYLLNKKARELGVNKLATGHNLDDEAQSILMNQIKNNIQTSARLGPITGVKEDKRFIRRIKPLYFLTEREVATYAFLKGFVSEFIECPNSGHGLRGDVRKFLNDFEGKYPGTKHAILNSFLEIMPLLRKDYKMQEIKDCVDCGEPCSQERCQTCALLNSLK